METTITTVDKTCFKCKTTKTFQLDAEQYKAWQNGAWIQNVLRHLSADDRELLSSGMCGKCFDNIFSIEEEIVVLAITPESLPIDKTFDLSGRALAKTNFEGAVTKPEIVSSLEEANIVTSRASFWHDDSFHYGVLDLDFPCRLIPSSRPDHYHLYLDGVMIEKEKYFKMLDAMEDAGVLQKGFVAASKERGFTAVRLPWIKKAPKDMDSNALHPNQL